ncbi:protein amnionless-like [Physella acuta]|uniref:protein amnionless-like n=1 Tax=Physella acuta TaxID=109671 RepID=UPI0027DCBFAC|nr:protein amnionless-like [Physella acuta]
MMKFFAVVCFVLSLTERGEAILKKWNLDANFENPNNWDTKKVPCGNDVTTIPEHSPVIFMNTQATLKELQLPSNAEIIFGLNAGISFSDAPYPGCNKSEYGMTFAAITPQPWLDPASWCPTSQSSPGAACVTTTPLLDTEMVPCPYDDVIFPKEHTFLVDLTSAGNAKFKVKSLKMWQETFYSSDTISRYLNSSYGRRTFPLGPGVGTDRFEFTRGCSQVGGCPCGNDRPEIAKQICSYAGQRCTRPRCKNAIQPVGACCKMCGAVFNLTTGYGFNFENFKSAVNNLFSKNASDGVKLYTSLTNEGWVQVVLSDSDQVKSLQWAAVLRDALKTDINSGSHVFAIDHMIDNYGEPYTPPGPDQHTGDQSLTTVSLAGIILGVIVGVLLIITIIVVFVFRVSGRGLFLPSMPRSTQPRTAAHIDPGFANPLFDVSPLDDGNAVFREMELIGTSQDDQPTFDVTAKENPLYVTTKSLFRDASASDDPPPHRGVAVTSTSGTIPIGHPTGGSDSTI